MPRTLKQLVEELDKEAYYHGRAVCLYDHVSGHHTVAHRKETIGHEDLRKHLLKEILGRLAALPPEPEVCEDCAGTGRQVNFKSPRDVGKTMGQDYPCPNGCRPPQGA